jgi:EAL domain-containing protein (putative c-di-GMP-specific phosphodiesterase class I)
VLFEPVVSLRGDSQEYYAVSARIPDAAGGQATAGETLSASDIERWVMERAMREQARERRRGRRAACVLRLSADSVQEPGLLIWICDTLREHQLRGSWLAFAVRATDAAAYAEPWQALSDGLRTVDCRICIDDDEGAEPSAAAIAAMRPDFLRFTPEVVAGLAGNTTLQQRLLARVRMAQREGIRTIVAGVRDARSLALFWDIGVDFVQGNLLQEALTDLDPRR